MTSTTVRLLALALLLPILGLVASPARAAAPSDYVTMVGDQDDYVSGGATHLYRGAAAGITLSGSAENGITVDAGDGASSSFTFMFSAAPGESLAAGDYVDDQGGADDGASIMIFGEGRGCAATGRFTILDVDPDATRLWLLYEQHCDGADAASFGEIRINEPAIDAELLTAPTRVIWPERYPRQAGRKVPVRLVNTGTGPITVSSASVTDGAADFTVVANGCRTIAAGASCAVTLGFTPTSAGPKHGTLTIVDSTTAGAHTVALGGSGTSGYTTWRMRSQAADYIGGGADYSYTPLNSTIRASGTPTGVHVASDSWTADFEPGSGDELRPGTTFTGATRYPFNESGPGLDISGQGRGCNSLTGTFTVHEATYDDKDRLRKLSVSFTQHCDGGRPALFGSITWRADQPGAPLPPRVGVTTDRATYRYGQKAVVTVKASDADVVSVYATQPGHPRRLVRTGPVDSAGRLTVRVPMSRTTTFTATADGGDLADASASKRVRVAARVSASAVRALRRSGKSSIYSVTRSAWLKAKVAPAHAGDCVYFRAEFKVRGRWGYPAKTKCVRLGRASSAMVYLPGDRAYLGIPIRMRAEWRGDAENAAAPSGWSYVQFVAQR
ncbi:hypothetical protein [Nocardioides conyzicola]|uniref:Abnormal spindle-like microcephaly-associated protein ASH domain-containing protein n=1 Tax=Nocardioides conyzicola TaxID=1651781 RepID=A0ABP8XAG5_9ACTN